jgi:hypothetical protein
MLEADGAFVFTCGGEDVRAIRASVNHKKLITQEKTEDKRRELVKLAGTATAAPGSTHELAGGVEESQLPRFGVTDDDLAIWKA